MKAANRQVMILGADAWSNKRPFGDLRKGDIFMLLEAGTQEYVTDKEGHIVFKAISNVYMDGMNEMAVHYEPADPVYKPLNFVKRV